MSDGAPTTYDELAYVLGNLPLLLREARRRRGLSLRTAATQLGMSAATVTRFENGEDVMLSNALDILQWIGQPDSLEAQAFPTQGSHSGLRN